MHAKEIMARLQREGFENIISQDDIPDTYYPDHVHAHAITHVIVEGEMIVTIAGKAHTLKKGERFDIPAGAVHSARISAEGCTYIIGERTRTKL